MVLSPRSRGKGNRRWPGRAGGARKRKPVGPWQRRCQHTVASPTDLPQPVVSLWDVGAWGQKLEHRAYVFDQEMARLGLQYFAVLGVRYGRRALRITISVSQSERVAEVIARLETR